MPKFFVLTTLIPLSIFAVGLYAHNGDMDPCSQTVYHKEEKALIALLSPDGGNRPFANAHGKNSHSGELEIRSVPNTASLAKASDKIRRSH